MQHYIDISSFVMHFSYLGILLCLLLGALGLPFPEDAILITSGFLVAQKTLNLYLTLAVLYAGLITSDLVIYYIGRHYGRKVVDHKWFGMLVSKERLYWVESHFKRRGAWVILIGRQVFGIRSQIILLSGVMRVKLSRFLAADAAAALITIGIMVTAGLVGGKALHGIKIIKETMSSAVFGVIAVGLVIFGFMSIRRLVYQRTGK
jgi:membrane protein DedA with SNARE-associated domain